MKSRKYLSVVFFLSGIALTLILSIRPMPLIYYIAEFILCSILWGGIAFKYRIIDKTIKNSNRTDRIISLILAITFIPTQYNALNFLIHKFESENTLLLTTYESYLSVFLSYRLWILIPIILFAAVSLCFVFMYISGKIRHTLITFFRNLETYERIFLFAGSIFFTAVILILFNLTTVFYLPVVNGELILFDVIYTSDTGAIVSRDCYSNPVAPENDLRQPLFGIFAMPFGLSARAVSFLLPFTCSYPVAVNIIQMVLLLLSSILLSQMLETGRTSKIYFLLLSVITFPFMLFSLNMEQYIFAVFWAILFIYNNYRTRHTGIVLPVAAVGSVLTSVLFIPILMILNKESRIIMRKGWKIICLFLSVFICGGMIYIVYNLEVLLETYIGFTSTTGRFASKFHQFTHFVSSCLFAPCSQFVFSENHPSYQLCINDSCNWTGIIILALSLLSGFLFRRHYQAKVCIYWVIFSFVLICLLGWGTSENGTILYTLYFSWAFIILLTLLIHKFSGKRRITKHVLFCFLILMLLFSNIKGILQIIDFGIQYYPLTD